MAYPWMHNSELAKGRARYLRNHQTPAEIKIWSKLSNRQFYGYPWRRQHNILDYIADLYCACAKLIIELDGLAHKDARVIEHDAIRTRRIEALGIKVLRFTNDQILTDWDNVAKILLEELRKRCPNPPQRRSRRIPSPSGEGQG